MKSGINAVELETGEYVRDPLAGAGSALSFLDALTCSDGEVGLEGKLERRLHSVSRITGAVLCPLTPVRHALEGPAAATISPICCSDVPMLPPL